MLRPASVHHPTTGSASGDRGSLEDRLLRTRVAPPPLFSLAGAPAPCAAGPLAQRSEPAHGAGDGAALEPLHAALLGAARARLGRSANRVEALLREAAAAGLEASEIPPQVRQLAIRGVTASTLAALADELERLLAARTSPDTHEV